jgi:hypothetical protein
MKDGGGPAFPVLKHHDNGHIAQVAYGVTMRDYFAGQAMQGMLAGREAPLTPHEWATCAYALADAMLAERSKT